MPVPTNQLHRVFHLKPETLGLVGEFVMYKPHHSDYPAGDFPPDRCQRFLTFSKGSIEAFPLNVQAKSRFWFELIVADLKLRAGARVFDYDGSLEAIQIAYLRRKGFEIVSGTSPEKLHE